MMEMVSRQVNEQFAADAFSRQSAIFDDLYDANTIISYKRERVREHVLQYLKPGGSILELNAGTGEDAIYFANKGFKVHATDISSGMLGRLRIKVKKHNLTSLVSSELCSYTALDGLKNKGPYDLVFSNFAGLNCTNKLDKVLSSLSPLLNPDGMITLVVLPGFCLWEMLLISKGKFRTAFRRFFSSKGRTAHVEGNHFKCWYYSPSYIINKLKHQFDILGLEGLCTIVPPSYIADFAEKHPAAYTFLKKLEARNKTRWPWKYIGDYYIISFRKKKDQDS